MKRIKIAIDGPAGSGKTTTAKIVAEKLGYIYIDTGAMYRAVTLAWLRSGTELNDTNLCKLINEISVYIHNTSIGQRTFLNGVDVSDDIRLPEVTKNVSPVSAVGCVREKLVAMQRELGKNGAVVLDGRDIGTVVFPDAELKIFLIANENARAERRTKELREKGIELTVEEIKQQIVARDNYDSQRSISPLRKADDAIEIDTSNLTIQQQSDLIIDLANKIIGE
ncbi:(d)CMP kinase [Bacteroidetes/Chlorobi group bacterium ChocPot_Mid]|jgi:cytidylate kinase|nr:MAG: (d)CMP kinase [Bacteroidetes/Chlorobi group bacterium ChocPot_Mid]